MWRSLLSVWLSILTQDPFILWDSSIQMCINLLLSGIAWKPRNNTVCEVDADFFHLWLIWFYRQNGEDSEGNFPLRHSSYLVLQIFLHPFQIQDFLGMTWKVTKGNLNQRVTMTKNKSFLVYRHINVNTMLTNILKKGEQYVMVIFIVLAIPFPI